TCHEQEVNGWLGSHHGMRAGLGLEPMTPAQARLPMKAAARDLRLSCSSCHGAHGYDTTTAGYKACLGCHDDEHSRNYESSPHFRALASSAGDGEAVTCATCHLPRTRVGNEVTVAHNVNDTLRPNEKMIRPVCLNCHNLAFSLDALADESLILSNFAVAP